MHYILNEKIVIIHVFIQSKTLFLIYNSSHLQLQVLIDNI